MRPITGIFFVGLLMLILSDGEIINGQTNSTDVSETIAIKHLRCEYHTNPLGIDIREPRLSWIVTSSQQGQIQSAYQILVASSKEKLREGQTDLWDTGKVESSETTQIVYQGKPLKSRMHCYWKIRVWGREGEASEWSEQAFWTMGLLEKKDWQAAWIGMDETGYEPQQGAESLIDKDFSKAKWIWYPEGDPASKAPLGERHFAKILDIPPDRKIRKVMCVLAGDNNIWLYVNGRESGRARSAKTAERSDLTEYFTPGLNFLVIRIRNEGNADNPAGGIAAIRVEFEQGEPIVVVTDGSWKAVRERPSDWTHPDLEKEWWVSAKEIGPLGIEPWRSVEIKFAGLYLPPPRYLRKEFMVTKPVKLATVYASALGLYELQINGKRVGQDYFTPGWTDYKKRVYYNTYDVTDLLKQGENALGAILADGWYAGYVGGGRRRARYSEKTRFRAQLEVEYSDHITEVIATNHSWKVSTGPLYEADFLMGESYDARVELPGWDESGYPDNEWKPVDVTKAIDANIEAYPGVTVGVFQKIRPVKISEPVPGRYVFDMGTNFAGVVRLKVKAGRGRKIVLRFAERLNPDGTVYVANLRRARVTDTYICKGDGQEIWQPRFTFHGFQYVELTGYPGKPDLDTITGLEFTSMTPVTGHFECSDEMANTLYRNICQTQRANFIDIPTDCPQRDERLGWTGDAQIYVRTSTYNTDTAAFFTKWLIDLEDAQLPSGAFPDVAPRATRSSGGTAAWGDAGVICPWTIYQVYGDTRVLRKHYDSMARWIEYCKKNSDNLIRPDRGYGDWLSIEADTAKDVLATAYFAYSTKLVAQIAEALGKQSDARKYQKLFGQIKQVFNQTFVANDGRIKSDTQTVYVLALAIDLLPGEKRKLAQQYLVEDIKKRGWHLSTGFVGTKDLMQVLTGIGRTDVAYRLFHNKTFPSWGFSIQHGATSIWERWDGWTPEKGFQDPRMNSFAHYSFGAVGEWMFKTIGGIDSDGPGYKHIIIRPQPGGKLSWAKVSYNSIRGLIATDWKLQEDKLTLKVMIPTNTTATVYLPTDCSAKVTESDMPANLAQGVTYIGSEEGCTQVYEVASGNYTFVVEGVKTIPLAE